MGPPWASADALKAAVLERCGDDFLVLFGVPFTEALKARLLDEFRRVDNEEKAVRRVLYKGRTKRAAAVKVLADFGVHPDDDVFRFMKAGHTPSLRALFFAVREKSDRISLTVRELNVDGFARAKDLREFVIGFFELLPLRERTGEGIAFSGSAESRQVRLLSDRELAVVSLLLDPTQVRTTAPMLRRTAAQVIDEERRVIRVARRNRPNPLDAQERRLLGNQPKEEPAGQLELPFVG